MSSRPQRIIDAHVHLWDPARTDWYPYLGGGVELELGDVTGMARRFDAATYRSESAGWNVVGLVNVAAATGAHSIDETLELDRVAEADGQPVAIVGGYVPSAGVAEIIDQIDAQLVASRFRGVRLMGRTDRPVPDRAVLEALRDRGLVLDLMAQQSQRMQTLVSDLLTLSRLEGSPPPPTRAPAAREGPGFSPNA